MVVGRKTTPPLPVVIVYKKPHGKKLNLKVFEKVSIDDILATNKHNPLIPINYIIKDIGVGEKFKDVFKQKYKIK